MINLAETDIKSSGYVIDTIEAALWSFLTTNSFEEAILRSVSLGGDTDTVAAITGALAGIEYGCEGIPATWLGSLRGKEMIATEVNEYYKSLAGY